MTRRRILLSVLLALCTLSLPAGPAAARNKSKPARFFAGVFQGSDPETQIWLATRGSKLYGRSGVNAASSSSSEKQVRGRFRSGHLEGELQTASGAPAGTLDGEVGKGTAGGVVTDPEDGDLPWAGPEAARDAGVMRVLAGKYSATQDQIELTLTLTKKGTFKILGFASVGFARVKVGTVKGNWLADQDGFVWLLITSVKLAQTAGVPTDALPREGTVERAGYTLESGVLTLTDPFDSHHVLYRLELSN